MHNRIAEHFRSNVVGYVALFFAFTGAAYALQTNSVKSKHIVDNQVFSADVRDDTLAGGGLTSDDLAPGSVTNQDVAANTLSGDQVFESGLVVGGDLTGSVGDAQIAEGAVGTTEIDDSSVGTADVGSNALTSADIDEDTLVDTSELVGDVDGVGTCDPDPEVTCASANLTAPAAGKVLLSASGQWQTDVSGAAGRCTFKVDGTGTYFAGTNWGEDTSTTGVDGNNNFAVTDFKSVTSGAHTISFTCQELTADWSASDVRITALWVP